MGKPAPLGVSATGRPFSGDGANAILTGIFTGIGPSQPLAFRGKIGVEIWGSYNTTLTTVQGSLSATVGAGGTIAPGTAVNGINVPIGTTIGTIAGTAVTLLLPTLSLPAQTSAASLLMTNLNKTDGLLGSTVSGPGIVPGTTVVAIVQAAVLDNGISGGVPGIVQLSQLPTSDNSPQNSRSFFNFALSAQSILSGADVAALFTGTGINYTGAVQIERSFDGGPTWTICNVGGAGQQAIYNGGGNINLIFEEYERFVFYRINCTVFGAGPINYRMSQTGPAATSLGIGGQ